MKQRVDSRKFLVEAATAFGGEGFKTAAALQLRTCRRLTPKEVSNMLYHLRKSGRIISEKDGGANVWSIEATTLQALLKDARAKARSGKGANPKKPGKARKPRSNGLGRTTPAEEFMGMARAILGDEAYTAWLERALKNNLDEELSSATSCP